jgi:hypothetical protein
MAAVRVRGLMVGMTTPAIHQDENGNWVNEYGESVNDPHGLDASSDFGYSTGDVGCYEASAGTAVCGAQGQVAVFQEDWSNPDGVDVSARVGVLKGDAYLGEHEAGLSIGASVVEVTTTWGEADPTTGGDTRVILGGSLGAGAGLHVIASSDVDGDGYHEDGVIVDVGPVTVGFIQEYTPPAPEPGPIDPEDLPQLAPGVYVDNGVLRNEFGEVVDPDGFVVQ